MRSHLFGLPLALLASGCFLLVDFEGEGGGGTGAGTTTSTGAAVCGDQIVDAGEQCDDGNASNQDECVEGCVIASCGDGFVQAGQEGCDDGNTVPGDGCSAVCVNEENCGDGSLDTGEECDEVSASCDQATCLRLGTAYAQVDNPPADAILLGLGGGGAARRLAIVPEQQAGATLYLAPANLAEGPPMSCGGQPCLPASGSGSWAVQGTHVAVTRDGSAVYSPQTLSPVRCDAQACEATNGDPGQLNGLVSANDPVPGGIRQTLGISPNSANGGYPVYRMHPDGKFWVGEGGISTAVAPWMLASDVLGGDLLVVSGYGSSSGIWAGSLGQAFDGVADAFTGVTIVDAVPALDAVFVVARGDRIYFRYATAQGFRLETVRADGSERSDVNTTCGATPCSTEGGAALAADEGHLYFMAGPTGTSRLWQCGIGDPTSTQLNCVARSGELAAPGPIAVDDSYVVFASEQTIYRLSK